MDLYWYTKVATSCSNNILYYYSIKNVAKSTISEWTISSHINQITPALTPGLCHNYKF